MDEAATANAAAVAVPPCRGPVQTSQCGSAEGDAATDVESPALPAASAGTPAAPAVPLGQALTSLLGLPAMRSFLGAAAAPAVACVALSIKSVLSGASAGTAGPAAATGSANEVDEGEGATALHIPPAVMEDTQDAGILQDRREGWVAELPRNPRKP